MKYEYDNVLSISMALS